MAKMIAFIALAGGLSFAACESFGQAMTAHTDVVARANGHELTVTEAASLLAANPRLPAQAEVVDAVANLWVDYILLATAAAEDSTLRSVDLSGVVRPNVEQAIVWKLRDKVIKVDTALTEQELRALYEKEQPDLQVRARHILLRLPADATPAQRDSVMALAEELRQRAAAGADFAALAREYSQDPGSAQQDGDLGFFGRGQMVAPFEEAAFALGVGAVSQVVESPFGLHVIKVEERKLPDFAQAKEGFRERAKVQVQMDAEEAYIKQLTDPRKIKIQEDAYEVARDLAQKPNLQLGQRAAARPLVTYEDGKLTAGEYQEIMRRFPPNTRARYAAASEEQLEPVLTALTKNEVLIQEAVRQGIEVSAAERDSMQAESRRGLLAAAVAAGLRTIEPKEGETKAQAIERSVMSLLEGIIKGERDVLPLGPVAYSLRDQRPGQVLERAYPAVVARVEASRPAATPAPNVPGAPPPAPAPPDTGAGSR
ncbi:MAG: peptidylprolyl isomerase [Gemmatimonadetes bacterium]|nr:peptidylprolyl isomerase [Gemmatimonadota bacterium]